MVALRQLLGLLPKIEEMEYMPIDKPYTMSNKEKFYQICVEALDTDPTPLDKINDEVACAETLSFLIQKIHPDFPILPSTRDLDTKLFIDKRFKRTLTPKRGDIIMMPRTKTTSGHCGIFLTEEKIASNTSKDGIWRGNYDVESWKVMETKRGLKTYYYELL